MRNWSSKLSLAIYAWLCHTALASAQMYVYPPNYQPPEHGAFKHDPKLQPYDVPAGPLHQPWNFAIAGEELPPNAFSEHECHTRCRGFIFAGLGFQALRREGLGEGNIALLDPVGIDTIAIGLPPGPPAVTFNNLNPPFNWGPRATLGIAWERHSFEGTGWYLFRNSRTHESVNPGRLNVLFAAFPPPIGFGGNLWNQADVVQYGLATTLASGEFNYRNRRVPWFEFIAGARYMYLREQFNIFTDDDSRSAPPVIPARLTDYRVVSRNHIFGPQIGFAIENRPVPVFSLSFEDKNHLGVNFIEVSNQLLRGDGFVGPGNIRNDTILTSINELRLFGTIYFTDNIRLRAGYTALWLINVPEAHQQVNFNPAVAAGNPDNRGSIFYHGPMAEFQIGF